MVRHFNFVDGIPTLAVSDTSVLVVESKEHRSAKDGTEGVSYSARYKDNPKLSYEFVSAGQFRHWLDEQGRMQPSMVSVR
jgi:hypothetical protein